MADALDQLNELRTIRHPAPEPVERLRERLAARRHRRRRHLAVATCLALAAIALVVIVVPYDDDSALRTVDDPTADSSSTTEGNAAPSKAALPEGSVISGESGIQIVVDGRLSRLSDEPTASAFSVGGGPVVAQAAEVGDPHLYPPQPTGPVLVLNGRSTREISPQAGDEVRLRDVGLVEGRAVALVTERTGSNPDDTDERMFLIDLETEVRTDLGSVGGWESGLSYARLVGSRIVTILTFGAQSQLVVRSLDGSTLWPAPDPIVDSRVSVAVVDDEVLLLQPRFEGDDFVPRLGIDRFQLASGDPVSSEVMTVHPREGLEITAGFCSYAESYAGGLICDRSGAGPIQIDLESGAAVAIAGVDEAGGVVTLPRAATPAPTTDGPVPSAGALCQDVDGTEPLVGGYALTLTPPGFVIDGGVEEMSTGFVDMGGESHATLRLSHPDGGWIEFDSFGMESPPAYVEELTVGAEIGEATYLRCVDLRSGPEEVEHRIAVARFSDHTVLATAEWEYGGISVTGGPDVGLDALLLIASGLRSASPAL